MESPRWLLASLLVAPVFIAGACIDPLHAIHSTEAAETTAGHNPKPSPSPLPTNAHAKHYAIKTKTAVMGVRGLDEVDLKAAQPNEPAVAGLDAYVPTSAEIEEFAQFKSKKLIPVADGAALEPSPEDAKELQDELKTGREIAATLLGGALPVEDVTLQKYVNRVGTWTALRSDRPDLRWRFAVLNSDSINAFAAPGGYVFITSGLYQKLHSEAELAGVLGHEITHIVSRDHYNRIILARAIAKATGMAKEMMQNMPAFKKLASGTAEHATLVFTSALDKSAETAADQHGMMLAADAGYEPFGLPAVLKVLALVPRDSTQAALLFKTHPSPSERLAAVAELSRGRLGSKAAAPDMRERFIEYDLSSIYQF